MVLSDKDIIAAMKQGEIMIDPFDTKLLNPGSYTFTFNNLILKPKWPKEIDVNTSKLEYEEIMINEAGYLIQPGEFLLGQTKEKVSISQNFCCILDARTTLARIGLNVLQGSTFIEPGQAESHETLEVSNIGQSPIRVYAGMKIVKGIFMRLESKSKQSYKMQGRYAKQTNPGVIFEKK